MRDSLRAAIAAGLMLVGLGSVARADTFPSRPVHIVVPFEPGGVTDVLARVIGQYLSQRWGQPVLVENRPGANTTIANGYVARAAPDGYTLGIILTSLAVSAGDPAYTPSYDPIKSFAPVVMLGSTQDLLVANAATIKDRSVKELIADATTRPGQINFGSSGTYTPGFLSMALFMRATGIKMVNVTYKGSGPMLTAVLRGEVQLTFGSVATFFPQTKDGNLVALAISGPARSPIAPNVPTLLEAADSLNANARALLGTNTNWYGVLAPAGTPADVVKKIHSGIVAALNDPDVATRLRAQGFVPDGRPPEVFARFLQDQIDEWKQLRNEKVLE